MQYKSDLQKKNMLKIKKTFRLPQTRSHSWLLTPACFHNPQQLRGPSTFRAVTFLPSCPWAKAMLTHHAGFYSAPGLFRSSSDVKSNSFSHVSDQCGQTLQTGHGADSLLVVLDIIAEQKRKWKVCHADLGAVCYVQLSAKGSPLGILTLQLRGGKKGENCVQKRKKNAEGSLIY